MLKKTAADEDDDRIPEYHNMKEENHCRELSLINHRSSFC